MPLDVGDFSDFSCSKEHNLRGAELVLGNSSLPPAFHLYPIGYAGRSSSLVVSGTPIRRPMGLYRESPTSDHTVFAPSRSLDFELEIGCVIGQAINPGDGCTVQEARKHIFGFVLLNDWSGRLALCPDEDRFLMCPGSPGSAGHPSPGNAPVRPVERQVFRYVHFSMGDHARSTRALRKIGSRF